MNAAFMVTAYINTYNTTLLDAFAFHIQVDMNIKVDQNLCIKITEQKQSGPYVDNRAKSSPRNTDHAKRYPLHCPVLQLPISPSTHPSISSEA